MERTIDQSGARARESRPRAARVLAWLRAHIAAQPIVASATLATVFLWLAICRDSDAEWRARSVWGNLEPLVTRLAGGGRQLTELALRELFSLSVGLSFSLAIFALLGMWKRRATLVLAALAAAALVWSWYGFDQNRPSLGWSLGALAAAGFCAVGWWSRRQSDTAPSEPREGDLQIVVWIVSLAALARLYALTELPAYFIGEMGHSMLAPVSWASLWRYVPQSVEAVSIGCAHLFLQWATFQLIGPSVFAIRLVAVLFGVALIWALFWLLRRSAGRQAAVVAACLAAVAPEQLWWSRNENSYFIATCFAGVVTAYLSWELRRRPSAARIFAVCIWMAASRLFYLASVALFLVPIAFLLHGLVFGPERRKLLFAFVLVSTFGVAGWALSPSLASSLGSGHWRFVHPARHGELAAGGDNSGAVALLAKQAEKIARNGRHVAESLFVKGGFDHWYVRVDTAQRMTWINFAAAGLAACGLLLALGRIHRPEAALLWLWFVAGLAPALLSEAPESRRLAAAFPALYAAAGYAWAWWLAELRAGGKVLVGMASVLFWPALASIAWASAASHFALPVSELPLVRTARVLEEDFSQADAIFYDADEAAFPIFAAVHAQRWLSRQPCLQPVGANWLENYLGRSCAYDSPTLRIAYSDAQLAARRSGEFSPRFVAFLIGEVPQRPRKLERLAALYPQAERVCQNSPDTSYALCTIRVRDSDFRGLRRVDVVAARSADGALHRPRLARPAVVAKAERVERGAATMRIEAALPVEVEGWYEFSAHPECRGIQLDFGDYGVWEPGRRLPLLGGVVPLTLTIPLACDAPLALDWRRSDGAAPALALLDPALAESRWLRAPPVRIVTGYRSLGPFGATRGEVIDVRPVAEGFVVLGSDGPDRYVQWLDASGRQLREQELPEMRGEPVEGFAVSAGGQMLVKSGTGAVLLDSQGKVTRRWSRPELPTPDLAWIDEQRLLAALPAAGGLVLLNREGETLAVIRRLRGREEPWFEPIAVARSGSGRVWAGVQTDGRIIAFRFGGEPDTAEFLWERTLPLSVPGSWARSLVFWDDDSLLVADRERPQVFRFDLEGRRLLAEQPEHDWPLLLAELGTVQRIAPFGDRLVVLAGQRHLVSFVRQESSHSHSPGASVVASDERRETANGE